MTDHPSIPPVGDDQHLDDEVLVALADGECTEAEAAAAETHLAACDRCAARRDLLGGLAGVAGAPVAPLPPEVRDEQIRRALAAGASQAPVWTVTERGERRGRRSWWQQVPARVAAALVVIAGLGVAAYGAARALHRSGGGPAASGMLPGSTTSIPGGAASAKPPPAELRPVAGPPPPSCHAVDNPPRDAEVALPDATDAPGRPANTCVLAGSRLAAISSLARATIHGAGGLNGPDSLVLELPRGVFAAPSVGSPPPGPRILLVADGAAVGVVRSITPAGANVLVVVDQVPPAVAEYLVGLLNGR